MGGGIGGANVHKEGGDTAWLVASCKNCKKTHGVKFLTYRRSESDFKTSNFRGVCQPSGGNAEYRKSLKWVQEKRDEIFRREIFGRGKLYMFYV